MLSEWDLNEMMKAARVPATARHVLRTIRMRLAMGKAFPSYQGIADDVGISRRAAIKTVGECVSNSWLSITKRTKAPGNSDTNEYALTPHQGEWFASGDHVCIEKCAVQVGGGVSGGESAADDHEASGAESANNQGGSDPCSLGVVNENHQGSDPRSPKQGRNEEGNEEGRQRHTPAFAGATAVDATAVSIGQGAGFGDPKMLADPGGIPGYLGDFCRANRVDDAEVLWADFQGYATRNGHRFSGAAWSKPAAARLFGAFLSAGLAQARGVAEEAA